MTDERMFELIRLMVDKTIRSVDAVRWGYVDPMTMIDIDSCVVYDNGDFPFVTLIGDTQGTNHMAWYGVATHQITTPYDEVEVFVSSTWEYTQSDCVRKMNRPDDAVPNEELTELFKLLLTTYKL